MKLVARWQDKPDLAEADDLRQQRFSSKVTKVTVEQTGPVRAVLKVEGVHTGAGRDWLPFVVRLYFYAGSDAVRIVHSFIYDGDPAKDFIAGLGVTADTRSTHRLLIKLEQFGHRLLAHFHSHPGKGADATRPSGTDRNFQERLESAGHIAVMAIFSRDGFIRFMRLDQNIDVQVYGAGVEQHEPGIYRLANID